MKKHILITILSVALFLLSTPTLFAQPDFDDDIQDTPIDGGIGLLVAAGIGYGITKLKKKKEK